MQASKHNEVSLTHVILSASGYCMGCMDGRMDLVVGTNERARFFDMEEIHLISGCANARTFLNLKREQTCA